MTILYVASGVAAVIIANNLLGKPVPFLRWSFIRMMVGMKKLTTDWQVGDGREEACARYVIANAKPGSIDDAIRAIDEYAYKQKFLINVGDEKGAILDGIVKKARPMRMLELGCYVGYSALRTARHLPPSGHLFTIEFNAENAGIARRIIAHAGATDKVTVVHGYLGDGGKTVGALVGLGFGPKMLDAVFIDHAKEAYLPDLNTLLEAGWLRPGSVVIADNVKFPGAPEYKAYMDAAEGKTWKTVEHDTYVEYQKLLPDLVLESTLL